MATPTPTTVERWRRKSCLSYTGGRRRPSECYANYKCVNCKSGNYLPLPHPLKDWKTNIRSFIYSHWEFTVSATWWNRSIGVQIIVLTEIVKNFNHQQNISPPEWAGELKHNFAWFNKVKFSIYLPIIDNKKKTDCIPVAWHIMSIVLHNSNYNSH